MHKSWLEVDKLYFQVSKLYFQVSKRYLRNLGGGLGGIGPVERGVNRMAWILCVTRECQVGTERWPAANSDHTVVRARN